MHPLMALLRAVDPAPAAKDVTAGWTAFAVFAFLCVAVAILGFSLVKHLRRAGENAEKGVFGPSPERKQ
jgi:hypothetical protein